MKYKTKLYLDDYRSPIDCVKYMHQKIGKLNPIYLEQDWVIVRNYIDFIWYIQKNGLPDLISFDHDLAAGHYHRNMQEGNINYDTDDFQDDDNKTGYHCAQWLVEYCMQNKLKLPDWIVHSMNPSGTKNIESLLTSFDKFQENE